MPALNLLLFYVFLFISLFEHVTAEPKVLGLDFKKEKRKPEHSSSLAKRQKTVQATIANEELLYLINVTIGTPGQPFSLQLDTGSSDIWVPDDGPGGPCDGDPIDCQLFGSYNRTDSETSREVWPEQFQVSYVDGTAIKGDYISDVLHFGNTEIANMTMGLATTAGAPAGSNISSRGLGIMGIGFEVGESIVTQRPNSDGYPNVVSRLKAQGDINTLAYSLWLNDLSSATGSILFGGVDTAKYHGELVALPIQPSARTGVIKSFTIVLNSMNLANRDDAMQYSQNNINIPVILDSGTTFTYLPDNIANDIMGGVGARDSEIGPIVDCSIVSSKAHLNFTFGSAAGPSIVVGLKEFVIPIVDEENQPLLNFSDGTPACQWGILAAGNDPNLFGDTFLRSAYLVYDLENKVIAIAQTKFDAEESHIQEIPNGSTIPGVTSTASGVSVTQTATRRPVQTSDGEYHRQSSTQVNAHGTPTFNLGGGTAGATATHKGSAAIMRPTVESVSVVLAAGCAVASLALSGVIIMLM